MRETNFCHFPLVDGLAATVIPAVHSGSASMMGTAQEEHECPRAGDFERCAKNGDGASGVGVCVVGRAYYEPASRPSQVPLDRLNTGRVVGRLSDAVDGLGLPSRVQFRTSISPRDGTEHALRPPDSVCLA